WTHPFDGAFPAVQGSALPVRQDPRHPFVNPVVSFRFGDLSNPNLKQWAKDVMKIHRGRALDVVAVALLIAMQIGDNDEMDAGKIQFAANSSCLPSGVPVFDLLPGPFYLLQTPTKVVILEEQNHQVRHIYLNVPHSADVKPSWYGESPQMI